MLAAHTAHGLPLTAPQVSLSYLKSYRGMGTARVACVAGCACEPQLLDGTWETEVSLQQILQFWVSGGGGGHSPAGATSVLPAALVGVGNGGGGQRCRHAMLPDQPPPTHPPFRRTTTTYAHTL